MKQYGQTRSLKMVTFTIIAFLAASALGDDDNNDIMNMMMTTTMTPL
jgi:hypothetical protein